MGSLRDPKKTTPRCSLNLNLFSEIQNGRSLKTHGIQWYSMLEFGSKTAKMFTKFRGWHGRVSLIPAAKQLIFFPMGATTLWGSFPPDQQSIQQNMPWRFMIFNCLYQDVDHGVVFGISICIKCHEYEKRVLVTLYQYLVGTLCKNVASCKGSVPRFRSLLSGDLDLLID